MLRPFISCAHKFGVVFTFLYNKPECAFVQAPEEHESVLIKEEIHLLQSGSEMVLNRNPKGLWVIGDFT